MSGRPPGLVDLNSSFEPQVPLPRATDSSWPSTSQSRRSIPHSNRASRESLRPHGADGADLGGPTSTALLPSRTHSPIPERPTDLTSLDTSHLPRSHSQTRLPPMNSRPGSSSSSAPGSHPGTPADMMGPLVSHPPSAGSSVAHFPSLTTAQHPVLGEGARNTDASPSHGLDDRAEEAEEEAQVHERELPGVQTSQEEALVVEDTGSTPRSIHAGAPQGGPDSARLPASTGRSAEGEPPSTSHAATSKSSSHQRQRNSSVDFVQPPSQASTQKFAPGLIPPQHPYSTRRKPPKAFMMQSPLRTEIEVHAATQKAAAQHDRAASARGPLPTRLAQTITNDTPAWLIDPTPPWVGGNGSSVSDLEALDTILDQLVVLDSRMRKALLKGPLISFETVIPSLDGTARGRVPQPPAEDDRTFMTAIGVVQEEEEEELQSPREAETQQLDDASASPATQQAEEETPRLEIKVPGTPQSKDGLQASELTAHFAPTLFSSSMPSHTMHPSLTRAYLHQRLSQKPNMAPPPAPTSEHLLKTRPPPFIAAPTYDLLCQQIKDVQRQYTCGSSRGGGAQYNAELSTNNYISGLDGPPIEDVVMQYDLPVSLERMRPTFVALRKAKSARPVGSGVGPRSVSVERAMQRAALHAARLARDDDPFMF